MNKLQRERAEYNLGFTLIELSIVLVIIGLIVGGMLVGRELIRSAELKSVITDINSFASATNAFRDKYYALPGDFSKATNLWGADASCPNTPNNSIPKIATCNGDGNGTVGPYPTATYETIRFWQHLADAGMIAGMYSGVNDTSGGETPGIATPTSRILNAGYSMEYNDGGTNFQLPEYMPGAGHFIYFGAHVINDITEGPAIPAGDAFNLDTKIDDGSPTMGKVRSFGPGPNPNCTTSATYPAEQYNLTKNVVACALMFRMSF